MPDFVSFAAHGEDIVAYRALRAIPRVTYLDVGAGDPLLGSFSRSLHTLGWRGVHVEPAPVFAQALRESRPHDVVVAAAIAAEAGSVPFFFVPGTRRSTTSAAAAAELRAQGWAVHESVVAARSLAEVAHETVGDADLHLLRIDIGGGEVALVQAAVQVGVAPWILVVPDASGDAATLEGYEQTQFDGINRWFVRSDHPELRGPTSYPAAVQDGWTRAPVTTLAPPVLDAADAVASVSFVLARAAAERAVAVRVAEQSSAELTRRAAALQGQVTSLTAARDAALRERDVARVERDDARREREHVRRERDDARERVRVMSRSSSWRLTRPWRALGRMFRRR